MRALSLVVLVGVVGCAEDPSVEPPPSNGPQEWAPALALGSGEFAFEALSDGDPLFLFKGTQGFDTYHANVGALVTGMSPEVAIRPMLTLLSTGTVLAGEQQPVYMALAGFDDADCSGEFWGVRAFLDDAEPEGDFSEFICSLEDERVELSVEVENLATQELVSGSVELVVALDGTAQQACP